MINFHWANASHVEDIGEERERERKSLDTNFHVSHEKKRFENMKKSVINSRLYANIMQKKNKLGAEITESALNVYHETVC